MYELLLDFLELRSKANSYTEQCNRKAIIHHFSVTLAGVNLLLFNQSLSLCERVDNHRDTKTTTLLFRYERNKIPPDVCAKVTNRSEQGALKNISLLYE